MESALSQLHSKRRFERERGLRELLVLLRIDVQNDVQLRLAVETGLLSMCVEERWESRHGGLLALAAYVRWLYQEASLSNPAFVHQVARLCLDALADKQVVVCLVAGEALAACVQVSGLELYKGMVEERLLQSIEENMYLERDEHVGEEDKKLADKLLVFRRLKFHVLQLLCY
jgi:hypothetical protein